MSTITLSPSLAAYIDEAGAIDAEIKRLTKQLNAIKAQIKEQGKGEYGGFVFNATVIVAKPVISIDWESIARKFDPSSQLITAYTTKRAPVTSIRFDKA